MQGDDTADGDVLSPMLSKEVQDCHGVDLQREMEVVDTYSLYVFWREKPKNSVLLKFQKKVLPKKNIHFNTSEVSCSLCCRIKLKSSCDSGE